MNCLMNLTRRLAFALFLVPSVGSSAQTFTTLVKFNDSSSVFSSLIQARDGNLYGSSENGGVGGLGSVFRVTPSGSLTTIYSFCSKASCADGAFPASALALGTDGNLYGTTGGGGNGNAGTVFRLSTTGTLVVLNNFQGSDGSFPNGGLTLVSDGNFYGTTPLGGADDGGVVFRINPKGTLTTLYSFCAQVSCADGAAPLAGLIQGGDGFLYGTTSGGGNNPFECSLNGGCGTVFKLTLGGKFSSLHSFNFTDGEAPFGPLTLASGGAFYGTTFEGGNANSHGCSGGCGTIFKVTAQGAFATVHKFRYSDGGNPESGLILGSDGVLYGESIDAGDGNIYKLTLPRDIETLYNFTPASEGGGTTAMVQATDGKFYGTYGVPGAVFSLDTGLAPFVAFVIPTGKVGQKAQILGQGLTGTTSVTFNGVPATSFSVVSDTYMTAVVPSGATTGSVVVTTPSGTLTSNLSFRISK